MLQQHDIANGGSGVPASRLSQIQQRSPNSSIRPQVSNTAITSSASWSWHQLGSAFCTKYTLECTELVGFSRSGSTSLSSHDRLSQNFTNLNLHSLGPSKKPRQFRRWFPEASTQSSALWAHNEQPRPCRKPGNHGSYRHFDREDLA